MSAVGLSLSSQQGLGTERRFLVGSPGDCVQLLLPWPGDLNVHHVVVRTHWAGPPVGRALSSTRLLVREALLLLRG